VPEAISEAEVWAAVQAEGLTLVPSSDSASGFKGVTASGGARGRRFSAQGRYDQQVKHLGRYATALEAALHVARHLGPSASAEAAAAAVPEGMSEAEVWAAVQAEGLTLVPSSDEPSGYKGVTASTSESCFFALATLPRGRKSHYLGCFATALEAALHVARFKRRDASATASAPEALEAPAPAVNANSLGPQQGTIVKAAAKAAAKVAAKVAAKAAAKTAKEPIESLRKRKVVAMEAAAADGTQTLI